MPTTQFFSQRFSRMHWWCKFDWYPKRVGRSSMVSLDPGTAQSLNRLPSCSAISNPNLYRAEVCRVGHNWHKPLPYCTCPHYIIAILDIKRPELQVTSFWGTAHAPPASSSSSLSVSTFHVFLFFSYFVLSINVTLFICIANISNASNCYVCTLLTASRVVGRTGNPPSLSLSLFLCPSLSFFCSIHA